MFDDNYLRALDQIGPSFKKKEVLDMKPKVIRQWFKDQAEARKKYLARVQEQQAAELEEAPRARRVFSQPKTDAMDAFRDLFAAAMHKHADKACNKDSMMVRCSASQCCL